MTRLGPQPRQGWSDPTEDHVRQDLAIDLDQVAVYQGSDLAGLLVWRPRSRREVLLQLFPVSSFNITTAPNNP